MKCAGARKNCLDSVLGDILIDEHKRLLPTLKLSHTDIKARLLARPHYEFAPGTIPADYRKAAVLLLLWPEDEVLNIVLTRRAKTLRNHAGQISFPGGRLDPGETFSQAALRETEEELGVPAASVTLLGRLDDAWSGAKFEMVPVVGFTASRPVFIPNAEVDTVMVMRMDAELELGQEAKEFQGRKFLDAIVRRRDIVVPGLTADILQELILKLHGEQPQRGLARERHLRRHRE